MAGSVVAAASQSGDTSSLTVSKPTGTADGDLMFGFQCSDYGTYANLTAPAGWSLLTGLDRGSNLLHFKVWSKVASSEGASYVFPQGSSVDGVIILATLRGVDTTAANWLYATPAWAANSTSRVAASVSGAASGAVLLCSSMVDMNDTVASFTPPSGMTEQADKQSNHWALETVATLLSPSNPTGTKTFTCSSSSFYSTNGGIEFSIVIPQTPTAPTTAGNFFAMM